LIQGNGNGKGGKCFSFFSTPWAGSGENQKLVSELGGRGGKRKRKGQQGHRTGLREWNFERTLVKSPKKHLFKKKKIGFKGFIVCRGHDYILRPQNRGWAPNFSWPRVFYQRAV